MPSSDLDNDDDALYRLDKWLWHTRFFKSRSAATNAISGGKVHLNGEDVSDESCGVWPLSLLPRSSS